MLKVEYSLCCVSVFLTHRYFSQSAAQHCPGVSMNGITPVLLAHVLNRSFPFEKRYIGNAQDAQEMPQVISETMSFIQFFVLCFACQLVGIIHFGY